MFDGLAGRVYARGGDRSVLVQVIEVVAISATNLQHMRVVEFGQMTGQTLYRHVSKRRLTTQYLFIATKPLISFLSKECVLLKVFRHVGVV